MSVTNFQLDLPEFKDDCLSIASSVSSNKSSKSFRSRLRERFVFSNSNSEEVSHKALEIDLENKNLKIENLEKELELKNKEIKELELEKNGLLDGILEMNNEMSKLKTKMAEKEVELSEIKAQELDREEISCIKTLLESQKESIIQSCMEMYDSKEDDAIIIKASMEKSNQKIESEIDIHKEEIAVLQPDSGKIAKCRSCQILKRQMVKYCQDSQIVTMEVKHLKAQLEQDRQSVKRILQQYGIEIQGPILMNNFVNFALQEIKSLKTALVQERELSRRSENHFRNVISELQQKYLQNGKVFSEQLIHSWSRNGEQFYETPSIGASQGSRLPEYVPQISQTSSFGASHISRITATHQFVTHPDPGKWGPGKWY